MRLNRHKFAKTVGLALLAAWFAGRSGAQSGGGYREWEMFGGGPENIHYSTLQQIDRENVNRLEVAWRFDSGDEFPGSEMQCNPIIVDGVLYATTPKLRVIALDAATGKLALELRPERGKKRPRQDAQPRRDVLERRRRRAAIFFGFRQWLYALDAKTGQPANDVRRGGAHRSARRLRAGRRRSITIS